MPNAPHQENIRLVAESVMNATEVQVVDDWHALACEALAYQLGVGHDWYYPLFGAAEKIRNHRLGKPYQE